MTLVHLFLFYFSDDIYVTSDIFNILSSYGKNMEHLHNSASYKDQYAKIAW
jgi:hypothetical protein